ncbi:glutathione S-transferase T3-like [Helianthus annuus]|uniref:glutathione S-transferase T3-like n=1 Tax=Helianthus annuus TaxID=4232 RepID=UPI000B8F8A19|nr:glutathione S-transferase T3-like [Helianthus annuus]
MSSWCLASENKIRGKNQRSMALWAEVKKLYDEAQAENLEKLGVRNVEQMKGRYKRLNESVQKWVGAYREAYRRVKSGMSQRDIEGEAHKIYEHEAKSKFTDSVVFNEVMCKHPKWELQIHRDTTRSRPECEMEEVESGGSTKRSRTTKEGNYSKPETPNSGGSTIQRPTGRDAAKKRVKVRDTENELFKRKLDLEQEKLRQKDERDTKKMQLLHLNTLLAKDHLAPQDEDMKNFLMLKFYGK